VSSANFPLANGSTKPSRHTRLRRWDQAGKVYESDGVTVWTDLTATGSTGDIPVPPDGTTLVLENGITVTFGWDAMQAALKSGDFWDFAARAMDGTVEYLDHAPARGIHHHYARLAVVTFVPGAAFANVSDCRIAWPPACGGGCACGCTVTVRPDDIQAANTLQSIVEKYAGQPTPTTICLMPGTYFLPATLRIPTGQANITIEACQKGTARLQAQAGSEAQFVDGLVALYSANNVALRGLQLILPVARPAPGQFAVLPLSSLDYEVGGTLSNLLVSVGVRAVSCSALTIENCQFDFADMEQDVPQIATPFGVGVFAGGRCDQWRLTGNTFAGPGGSFLAGFLLAPTVVSFNPPPAIDLSVPAVSLPNTLVAAPTNPPVAAPTNAQTRQKAPAAAPPPAVEAMVPPKLAMTGRLTREEQLVRLGTAMSSSARDGGAVMISVLSEAVFENNSFSGLTIAALIYAQSQTVQFTANETDDCQAGFWLLSPAQAGLLVYDPQALALIGLSVALGYPLPQQSPNSAATSPTVLVPAAPESIRIYMGKTARTDSAGHLWHPEADAPGVTVSPGEGGLNSVSPEIPITGAKDSFLYQSERWGPSFSYTFSNLNMGYYQVTLKFAEIFDQPPLQRLLNVLINGQEYLAGFDITADAGGWKTADDKVFANISPDAQGRIVVQFQGTTPGSDPNAKTDLNAKISAVEIDPQWSGTLLPDPYRVSPDTKFVNYFTQLAQLAQQAFASLANSPLRLRITDNELHGLSSLAFLVLWDDQLQNGNVSSLMMTGNRLDTLLRFGNLEGFSSNTTVSARNASDVYYFYFLFAASVSLITRCVVSANMMLNQTTISVDQSRGSFLLNDTALPLPVAMIPAPQIAVMGNVFQGVVFIAPPRDALVSPAPAPMNTWDFLNTVFP
jgi:hypothetical protein